MTEPIEHFRRFVAAIPDGVRAFVSDDGRPMCVAEPNFDAYTITTADLRRVLVEYEQFATENTQIEGLQNGIHNHEQWLAEECRKTETLRAQVAAVRAYADSLYSADRKIDACGVREKLYELLPLTPAKRVGTDFRWHVLSACPDEAACPIHGRDDTEPIGPEDLPELTAEDAVEAMEDMAGDLYRAEDRLAFVREMCDLADREQRQISTEQVRAWTQYTGCGGVLVLPETDEHPASIAIPAADELAEADRYADMVNAPLRPETIAALAKRIKSGDYPVRKVRKREEQP